MSIDLIGVRHSMKPWRSPRRLELRDINMHIEENQRVGLLGKKGTGIDEILAIMCGAIFPARGDVRRTSEISWPIGESSFLSPDVSLAANLRFMARIYEADEDAYAARVSELTGIDQHWDEKFGSCPKEIKARFAFGLGVCLPFDIYIFDSGEVADKNFREKGQEIVARLGHECGTVVATGKGETALQLCDRGFVLDAGTITYYEDIEAAVAHLERLEELAPLETTDEPEEEQGEEFDIV